MNLSQTMSTNNWRRRRLSRLLNRNDRSVARGRSSTLRKHQLHRPHTSFKGGRRTLSLNHHQVIDRKGRAKEKVRSANHKSTSAQHCKYYLLSKSIYDSHRTFGFFFFFNFYCAVNLLHLFSSNFFFPLKSHRIFCFVLFHVCF